MRISEIMLPPITYEISSGKDTINLVDEVDRDLWTSRRIKYLDYMEARKETHILAREGENIVGMAGMQTNPYYPVQLWIKFISVDPAYQGRGIARQLLERIYQFAEKNNQKLKPGSFTDEGQRLSHIHDEFDQKYPGVAFEKVNGQYVDSDGRFVV